MHSRFDFQSVGQVDRKMQPSRWTFQMQLRNPPVKCPKNTPWNLLTIFDAHEAVGHQFQARGTGAGYARTPLVNPGSWQAEMRAVAIHRLAVVDTVGLAVGVVHMHHHRMFQLQLKFV